MEKNEYSAPIALIQHFSGECIAADSAVTATEDALKHGKLKVDGQDVSTKPVVSVRF